MSAQLESRIDQLQEELGRFTRVADHLGIDVVRPVKAYADGYPENTVVLVGKIAERLLKELWITAGVEGDPANRPLSELLKHTRDLIRSPAVLEALRDIQHRRNRSSHDGYDVADEDALFVLRRLIVVLEWFTAGLSISDDVQLDELIDDRLAFLTGLYLTIGYRVHTRFDLSSHTTYALLERARGARVDLVELVLSSEVDELGELINRTGGVLSTTTLSKRTRFVVIDDDLSVPPVLAEDAKVVRFDDFLDSIVDAAAVSEQALALLPQAGVQGLHDVDADLLELLPRTVSYAIRQVDDPVEQVLDTVEGGGNLLVIGPAGSGKSTLLRAIAAGALDLGSRTPLPRYRFYIDLALRDGSEPFTETVTRQLAPAFCVEPHEVYETFLYLIRSGRALCLVDAIDEGAAEPGPEGLLQLFADISETLSAESTTILASRTSFLLESPYVRQLLDRSALVSERLTTGLSSQGVDPLELPSFSVLKLGHLKTTSSEATPSVLLDRFLEGLVDGTSGRRGRLSALLAVVDDAVEAAGADAASVDVEMGAAVLAGRRRFTLVDVFNAFGPGAFEGSRLAVDALRLGRLFEPVGRHEVRFVHSIIGEAIAARLLWRLQATDLDAAVDNAPVSDQVRSFLTELAAQTRSAGHPGSPSDLRVEPGSYVVGPPDNAWVHRQERAFAVDPTPVTVGQYLEFIEAWQGGEVDAVSLLGPATRPPDGWTPMPYTDRLRSSGYFERDDHRNHPAICIDWFSASSYAAWAGKRLPTSLEWELAARGRDGRLFPWGDDPVLGRANSADEWCGRMLLSYEEWKHEFDAGALRDGLPTEVGSFPLGASPIGALDMAGNVWEWTATTLADTQGAGAVIAGGSFDNPLRALRCFSRGVYRLAGRSNAVGFRCVQDQL